MLLLTYIILLARDGDSIML